VIIGFLRSTASADEVGGELSALEQAGCDRIIVDNTIGSTQTGMLAAVIGRLADGDVLTVWALDSLAESMAQLVHLILELDSRNVRLKSLKEGFDSQGRHRSALKDVLNQLAQFDERLKARQEQEAKLSQARRVGRPRSLSEADIDRARRHLRDGRSVDDVAKELNVSRATLYRYLEPTGSGPGKL
jgi:DNA invertase Pin-like site-specific DNA recombinase